MNDTGILHNVEIDGEFLPILKQDARDSVMEALWWMFFRKFPTRVAVVLATVQGEGKARVVIHSMVGPGKSFDVPFGVLYRVLLGWEVKQGETENETGQRLYETLRNRMGDQR